MNYLLNYLYYINNFLVTFLLFYYVIEFPPSHNLRKKGKRTQLDTHHRSSEKP